MVLHSPFVLLLSRYYLISHLSTLRNDRYGGVYRLGTTTLRRTLPDSPTSAPVLPETASQKKGNKWGKWLLAAAVVVSLLVGAMTLLLDPWLRRTLEQQVTKASEGYYQLRVGELRTSLWNRSVTLRNIRLRSHSSPNQRLPRLRADVGEVRVRGVVLLALLRRKIVPLDTVLVQNVRLRVGKMPPSSPNSDKPWHERLPLKLPGLHLGYLALINLGGNYAPVQSPEATLRRADLRAHDILISAAGAADSQRLGYARRLAFHLADVGVQAQQHTVSLRALRFSTDRQRLELDSVRVKPSATSAAQKTSPRLTLTLPQLRLTGLQASHLARQQLQADSLILNKPTVTFIAGKQPANSPTKQLHEQLPSWLRRCAVRVLALSGGQIELPGLSVAPTIRAITVRGQDVRLDSLSARDKARVFYARAWQLSTGPGTGVLDAPFYRARYEKLYLDTRTGAAQADGLALTSTLSAAEFARRKAQAVPRMTVRIGQLRLAGLDYAALAREGAVLAKALELHNPRLDVTSDANYPQPARPSTVTPEQLRQLPFRLDIGLARIINFNFRSAEIVRGGSVPGLFSFTRFNASITHLTNAPRPENAPQTIARVSGWIENNCLVDSAFRFNLRDPLGSHSFLGTFGAAQFAMLNPVSEPAAFIRFERGRVQRMVCQLQFSRQGAQGRVWARYSDLKIVLLNKQPGPDRKNVLTRAGT